MAELYNGAERRMVDPIQMQIEEAIRLAAEPKDRAFLLIMNKIAQNLEENTSLTKTLSTDLKEHTVAFGDHEKKEMALINQGRGFWRAALVSLMVFQGLCIWWIQQHLAETKVIRDDVDKLMVEAVVNKEQHKTIAERMIVIETKGIAQ